MKLENKVALITGASSGIGRAIALKFAEEGASIVVNYISSAEKDAEKVKAELEQRKATAYLVQADVSKYSEMQSLVEKAIREFGRIDILVNNAGIYLEEPFWSATEEDFHRILDINLKPVFFLSRLVAEQMQNQQSGCIINMASNAGIVPKKDNRIIYGISKAAIIYLTKSLALTLAPKIRVNALAPGYVETQMLPYLKDRQIKSEIEARLPLKRINQPEDIANLALFLASDDSRNITGQTIIIDSGASLQ